MSNLFGCGDGLHLVTMYYEMEQGKACGRWAEARSASRRKMRGASPRRARDGWAGTLK